MWSDLLCDLSNLCACATAGGRAEAASFAQRYLLSESALEAVQAGRGDYAGVLSDLGFLPHGSAHRITARRRAGEPLAPEEAGMVDGFTSWHD